MVHQDLALSLENWVCGQGISDLNFALIWNSIGKKTDSSWPLTETAPDKVGKGRRLPLDRALYGRRERPSLERDGGREDGLWYGARGCFWTQFDVVKASN